MFFFQNTFSQYIFKIQFKVEVLIFLKVLTFLYLDYLNS